MYYNYNGLSGFGKASYRTDLHPMSTAPQGSWNHQKQMMEMQHKHKMEMMKIRLEMAQLQRSGINVPNSIRSDAAQTSSAVSSNASAAAIAAAASDIAKLKADLDALRRKEQVTSSGGSVTGSSKSVEELLIGKDSDATHQKFTPTTAKTGLKWNDWRKLKARLPADFNEAKYLSNNPDVAAGVAKGQFPSGAWHYVMHGSANCAAGQQHGGSCDTKVRAFKGWRRPGYLSGIFSNWDQN